MTLSELKKILNSINELSFRLPNGELIPKHFHVTEVGLINKHFIDCGGTTRKEAKINFQLWYSTDYDHKLAAQKFKSIVELSEKNMGLPDAEIEVEYQGKTIGKYGLAFTDGQFHLTTTHTDCLAKDNCGIPEGKTKIKMSDLGSTNACCTPESNCC